MIKKNPPDSNRYQKRHQKDGAPHEYIAISYVRQQSPSNRPASFCSIRRRGRSFLVVVLVPTAHRAYIKYPYGTEIGILPPCFRECIDNRFGFRSRIFPRSEFPVEKITQIRGQGTFAY